MPLVYDTYISFGAGMVFSALIAAATALWAIVVERLQALLMPLVEGKWRRLLPTASCGGRFPRFRFHRGPSWSGKLRNCQSVAFPTPTWRWFGHTCVVQCCCSATPPNLSPRFRPINARSQPGAGLHRAVGHPIHASRWGPVAL